MGKLVVSAVKAMARQVATVRGVFDLPRIPMFIPDVKPGPALTGFKAGRSRIGPHFQLR